MAAGREAYAATTYEDIAGAAGVARATVFNHFPRKDLFIEAWVATRRNQLEPVASDDSLATLLRLRLMMDRLADAFVAEPSRNKRLALAWVEAGMLATSQGWATTTLFTAILRQGVDRGEVAVVDLDAAGRLIQAGLIGEIVQWASDDDDPVIPLHARLRLVIDMSAHGVLTTG